MGAKTAIEWTDSSWTPIRARNVETGAVGWHCEHATPGCEFCYSERINRRLGTGLGFRRQDRSAVEVFLDETMLGAPLRWKKPRRIFVCSMTDLFGEFVPDEMIDRVFAVMALCPQHTFQVLTKRAERMKRYFTEGAERDREIMIDGSLVDLARSLGIDEYQTWKRSPFGDCEPGLPLPNVWLGVSVEDQARADERIPLLLHTPAAVRFISAEPLLGPVDLTTVAPTYHAGEMSGFTQSIPDPAEQWPKRYIDWVICGGESGPGARPMQPDWARALRDQCEAAAVPFFMKQMTKKADIPSDLFIREFPGAR